MSSRRYTSAPLSHDSSSPAHELPQYQFVWRLPCCPVLRHSINPAAHQIATCMATCTLDSSSSVLAHAKHDIVHADAHACHFLRLPRGHCQHSNVCAHSAVRPGPQQPGLDLAARRPVLCNDCLHRCSCCVSHPQERYDRIGQEMDLCFHTFNGSPQQMHALQPSISNCCFNFFLLWFDSPKHEGRGGSCTYLVDISVHG